ncbi:hypothetical protein [Mycobacterium sp. NPDC006124]|uniref:hypothetical protein n=1 Tax=Mycobacterium sp. NPDC006124 TaxID=3156729 RepID=UPI0033B5E0DE
MPVGEEPDPSAPAGEDPVVGSAEWSAAPASAGVSESVAEPVLPVSLVGESAEDGSSAWATPSPSPCPVTTAAPIPSATASAPTRPM